MRTYLLMCALAFATPLQAAEDYRVMKLEQDVRTLERKVQSLERLVTELQRRSGHSELSFRPDSEHRDRSDDTELAWLQVKAWDRVRLGMSELEVIEILGKPTALRPDANQRRALLYTLEVGTTSFLTGAVAFEQGKVVDVQKPTLR